MTGKAVGTDDGIIVGLVVEHGTHSPHVLSHSVLPLQSRVVRGCGMAHDQ